MAIQIIAVRLTGGHTHQHITHLWWVNPSTGTKGDNSRAVIVQFIEVEHGKVFVNEAGHPVEVLVRRPEYGEKYLQTRRDGIWQNNLLALPRW